MIAAPSREDRPGGRWSTPGLLGDLLRLAALERAVAHVIAGWVPKVPELDDKLGLAAGLEASMKRAVSLRGHALGLLERDESALSVRETWIEPLRAIDASLDAGEVIAAVLGDVTFFLLGKYRDLCGRVDPLYDARLLDTLRSAIDTLAQESSPISPLVGAALKGGSLSAALDRAWSDDSSPLVPLDGVLWGPQDRVPVPGRPAGRPRPLTGAMGHLRAGSRREAHNIAGELNSNVIAELCALELMCRCSYEHPDLPWAFHMAVARHATDEARHAAIFRRLLAQRGFAEDDLPQHASNYEFAYEFPECEVGSKRELVWRLLLLCTVLEGLAIDKIPPEIATLDWLDQPDIARALDYISTEEVFHAENGLRLTRRLCDDHNFDPMLERERVHGRFFARQLHVRTLYLEADPERAAREILIMEADPDGVPFESRTEVELRARASFTSDECDQVDRWGYNSHSGVSSGPS